MKEVGIDVPVRRLKSMTPEVIDGLSQVLVDCVAGGASVSFMAPFDFDAARTFWRGVAQGVADGSRAVLVAEDGHGIVGTVQLVLAQPPNQPHRADLAKMLVHRRGRRRGVGAALLRAAEEEALRAGKALLVLDTASAEAERLYERAGWQACGFIPDYALLPDGVYCGTRLYYKRLVDALPAWRDAPPLTSLP